MAMVDRDSAAGRADWHTILRRTLPSVDLFLPSLEETLLLLWPSELDRLARGAPLLDQVTQPLLHDLSGTLLSWGPGIVGFKLGKRGIYLRTAGAGRLADLGKAAPASIDVWASREIWSPVFKVAQVAGTTGAGDATVAGFLTALLRGCGPEETLTFACAVGACSVEKADALSGLKNWDETWQRIRSGWSRARII
jgi:sugar/nucleoside kinase (ribokinase family)